MKYLISFILTIVWVCGIVIAKGFWSTLFALLVVPFWSMYLVAEAVLKILGVV